MAATHSPTHNRAHNITRRFVWSKWENCGFPEKVNHAVASWISDVDQRHFMYALGGFKGRGSADGINYEVWNELGDMPLDVVRLDVASREWTTVDHVATVPSLYASSKEDYIRQRSASRLLSGRFAHSCCCYKNKLYMYGGRNDYDFCEGIECFDIASQTWSLLKTSTEDCDPPTGRYAHICTLNGPLMYIQGGSCLTRGYRFRFTADVLSFNLDTHTWRMVPCDGLDTRELPVAREFHSGHYVNGNIYIFGGKCPSPEQDDNGFYKFNLAGHQWSRLDTTGYCPIGRRSLASVVYGASQIVYFGGFSTTMKIFLSDLFSLDTNTGLVTNIIPYGMGPSPRRRVGMCLMGSEIVICGGVGKLPQDQEQSGDSRFISLGTFSDMYILHLVPSLQQLCMIYAANNDLDPSPLPTSLRRALKEMTQHVPNQRDPI